MFKKQGTPAETSNNANAISPICFRNFRLPALPAILVIFHSPEIRCFRGYSPHKPSFGVNSVV